MQLQMEGVREPGGKILHHLYLGVDWIIRQIMFKI
jgi:hypothetical protein